MYFGLTQAIAAFKLSASLLCSMKVEKNKAGILAHPFEVTCDFQSYLFARPSARIVIVSALFRCLLISHHGRHCESYDWYLGLMFRLRVSGKSCCLRIRRNHLGLRSLPLPLLSYNFSGVVYFKICMKSLSIRHSWPARLYIHYPLSESLTGSLI